MSDIHESERIVSGVWVGETLPPQAELCIRSYLALGIGFRLFAYRNYANVPAGTQVLDAREILPEEEIFRHEIGSLSTFADWFRYAALEKFGGFWTDLDVVRLSPELPDALPWFAEQEPGLAAIGFIGFPPGHPAICALKKFARDPAEIMPWDGAEERAAKKRFAENTPDARERRIRAEWGHAGPPGFTRAMKHFELMSAAAPARTVYPLPYTVWRNAFNGAVGLDSPELKGAQAVHLWGEMLRREPDAWENMSRGSLVAQLMARLMPTEKTETPPREKKRFRILVGVCSCVPAKERREAVRETWMKDGAEGVECLFFLGGAEPPAGEPDVVRLNAEDDYAHLPEKVFAFFRWALENRDFDFLFKCDDDTLLDLDRLAALPDPEYDLLGDESVTHRGAPSGGAGYLLSRATVEKLVAARERFPRTGAEDVIVGEAVRALGGKMKADARLRFGNSPFPLAENDLVSAHWCSPEMLRAAHFFRTANAEEATELHGKHDCWEDDLLFFGNGLFRRVGSGCAGKFEFDGNALTLRWFSWAPENLVKCGKLFAGTRLFLSPKAEREAALHELPRNAAPEKNPGMKCALLLTEGEKIEGEAELKRLGYSFAAYPTSQAVRELEDSRFEEFRDFLGADPGFCDRPYARSLRISFVKMLRDPAFDGDDFVVFGESDAAPVIPAGTLRKIAENLLREHPDADVFRLFSELSWSPSAPPDAPEHFRFRAFETGEKTRNCAAVWGTHALLVPAKKRARVAEIFSKYRLPTDTALEAANTLGELKVVSAAHNFFYQKPRTARADRTKLFSARERRIALCVSSYKRFEDLTRQIYALMNQSYGNFHLFVAAKGCSEHLFRTVLLPQFREFIDAERLTLRLFPNKNQLSNFLDATRGLDVSGFELFFKIDDDDFYGKDYVKTVNDFYTELPQHYSCWFSGWGDVLYRSGGYPRLGKEFYGVFGATMVFSRQVMDALRECEKSPEYLRRALTLRGVPAETDWGFREDNLMHRLMELFGGANIADFLRKNPPEAPHVIVQKTNASVMRGGLVGGKFYAENREIYGGTEELVVEVRHPEWSDALRVAGTRAERCGNADAADVLFFDGNALRLKWDGWGEEFFEKQPDGAFVFAKPPRG